MIADTDTLSQLAKVGKLLLLPQIFGEGNVKISFEVYQELIIARERNFSFAREILDLHFPILSLDQDLMREYEKYQVKLTKVHAGELSSILLCLKLDEPFLSNDKKAHQVCDDFGVVWLDICDLLSIAYHKEILNREAIFSLIHDIEDKDCTRIRNPERIFAL